MTLVWPCNVINARSKEVSPVFRTVAGSASLTGLTQVTSSDAGIWKVSLQGIALRNRQHVILWRALEILLEGRLNPVLVCCCDIGRMELPPGVPRLGETVTHSDHTYFSDGSAYENFDWDARVAENTALGAVRLRIRKDPLIVMDIQPGHRFSIGERLYQIRTIVSETSAFITCKVWPPLREDVAADAPCNFARPHVRVRLATDGEMGVALDLARYGDGAVNFFEDV